MSRPLHIFLTPQSGICRMAQARLLPPFRCPNKLNGTLQVKSASPGRFGEEQRWMEGAVLFQHDEHTEWLLHWYLMKRQHSRGAKVMLTFKRAVLSKLFFLKFEKSVLVGLFCLFELHIHMKEKRWWKIDIAPLRNTQFSSLSRILSRILQ